MGTGLVTLGVALTGVAGLSNDLQAASRETSPTTPLLTPQDEISVPGATPATTPRLDVDCPDRRKSRET